MPLADIAFRPSPLILIFETTTEGVGMHTHRSTGGCFSFPFKFEAVIFTISLFPYLHQFAVSPRQKSRSLETASFSDSWSKANNFFSPLPNSYANLQAHHESIQVTESRLQTLVRLLGLCLLPLQDPRHSGIGCGERVYRRPQMIWTARRRRVRTRVAPTGEGRSWRGYLPGSGFHYFLRGDGSGAHRKI
jgi:hypothetical protein